MKKKAEKIPAKRAIKKGVYYSPDFIGKMIEFFSVEPTRQENITMLDKKGQPTVVKTTVANRMPEFYRFAEEIGCSEKSIYNWAKEHPEFKEAMAICKKKTASFINYLACNGFWNPQYSMFLAPNYTDLVNSSKVENTHSGQITTVQRKVINLPPKKSEGAPVG